MYPSQNIRTLRILKTLSIFHNDAGNSITDAILLSGQSDRMVLQAYTQKSDQLFETNESALTNMDGFQLTPVFGVLMTVGCSMAIVFLSISGNKWHFFTKIVLTCCEKKKCSSVWDNVWNLRYPFQK